MDHHGKLLPLLPLLVLLPGCGMIGNKGRTQAELLTAKIQCAEEGRKYEKTNPTTSSNFFDITYSPRLNTCIVLRQQIATDGTDTMDILDILNKGRILDTATTTSTKRYGTATYQLWKSLFNEVNLGIDFNKPGATVPAL